jgi:ferredoxin
MIRIRLEPAGLELALPPGERLLDALDDAQLTQSALPSSCRAANCGECLLRVTEGGSKLAPASARERAMLRELGAGQEQRLGCQVHAELGASGAVVVHVIGS